MKLASGANQSQDTNETNELYTHINSTRGEKSDGHEEDIKADVKLIVVQLLTPNNRQYTVNT